MQELPAKSTLYFCENLIDYAGLFPPASLPLAQAFSSYINYKNSHDYTWMLSKFICPVRMLNELNKIIDESFPREKNIQISVLGRGGKDFNEFSSNVIDDILLWENFISLSGDSVNTDVFEIKLPDELISGHNAKNISDCLDFISNSIEKNIQQPVFIFLEGNTDTHWKKNISSIVNGIQIHNLKQNNAGFKLRTGGTEADSFPSPELIAFSIRECLDREMKMKFTAGLHHPFRHYDKEIKTMMHGFINVFGAGIIAMRHNISNSGIEEMLTDENPGNFIFTDDTFSWKDWVICPEDIKFARKNLVVSYGSCSFDEPVDDLKSLKIL